MLLTVTLNPAIDRVLPVAGFKTGGIFRIAEARVQAGGKGLNVARAAHALGLPVCASAPIAGVAGAYFASIAAQEAFSSEWIALPHGETRTCTLIVHPPQDATVINESGPTLSAEDWRQISDALLLLSAKAQIVAFSGSVSGTQPDGDAFASLRQRLLAEGCRIALDTSRTPLKAALKLPLWLLKVNASELAAALAEGLPRHTNRITAILQAAQRVQAYGPQHVVITDGARGAGLVCESGCWWATPPQVQVISTVGAGDSSLAGFCAATLLHDMPPHEALRYAVAAGTANTLNESPGGIELGVVEALVKRVKVERV
jgi:1-phosphofructokinase family hexose kinase